MWKTLDDLRKITNIMETATGMELEAEPILSPLDEAGIENEACAVVLVDGVRYNLSLQPIP